MISAYVKRGTSVKSELKHETKSNNENKRSKYKRQLTVLIFNKS